MLRFFWTTYFADFGTGDQPGVIKYFCPVVRHVVPRRRRDIGEHIFLQGYAGMPLDVCHAGPVEDH